MPREGSPHPDSDAGPEPPTAARITRRRTGERCWEFVDDDGLVVAAQQRDELSTAGRTYKFTRNGLEDAGTNTVIIPQPRWRRLMNALTWGYRRRQYATLDMPDGTTLFWTKTRTSELIWTSPLSPSMDPLPAQQTAAISNRSGETLVILRGLGEDAEYNHMREALIPVDVDFTIQQILLTAYAFNLFDSLGTRGDG